MKADSVRVVAYIKEMAGYVEASDPVICAEHRTGGLMPRVEPVSDLEVFRKIEGGSTRSMSKEELIQALIGLKKLSRENAGKMVEAMRREGEIYENKTGYFRRVGIA